MLVLLIPAIAMQFSEEVKWSLKDFLVAGILLLIAGLSCEWILQRIKKKRDRILLCAGVFFLFLLVWAELAVGIFGTPFAGS